MSALPRIFVSGASGFLGSAVVRALNARTCRLRLLQHRTALVAGNHEVVCAALDDMPALETSLQGCNTVVHAAGLASEFARSVADFTRCNVDGTRNMLAAARRAGVQRFVYVSSVMAFGPSDGAVFVEADFDAGRSVTMPYQSTKRAATQLVRAARGAGMEIVVLYPAALIGSGAASEGNWMGRFAGHLLARRFAALPSVGQQRFCLAHVDDVARGIAEATLRSGDGEWILAGDNVSVADVYAVLRREFGAGHMPPLFPAWLLHGALMASEGWARLRAQRPVSTRAGLAAFREDWAYSSAKARNELGFSARPVLPALAVQLQEMLRQQATGAPQVKAGQAPTVESTNA